MGHSDIGTEHICLGLIGEADGVAARVLASCGLELDGARESIRRFDASRRPPRDPPAFTPGAKQVLERALREALARDSSTIGTEHLLLGLVTPTDDVVASLFAERGVTGDAVRLRVENVLSGRPPVADGVIERYFWHLSSREWAVLGTVLSAEVVRVGPLGDEVIGREPYLALLAEGVPERYGNDVHRIVYGPGGSSAFARVTEHLFYPGGALHLEETYAFEIDEPERITRVEVFWQSPGSN